MPSSSLMLVLVCASAVQGFSPTWVKPSSSASSSSSYPSVGRHVALAATTPPQKFSGEGMPDASKPAGIAAMLEVTFVKSCMQLASGYVDTLKLFISAALAGYEQGFTIPALMLELGSVPTQTAGRPLSQEEVDLRTVWLSLVYLVAENVGYTDGKATGNSAADAAQVGSSVPAEIRSQFCTFVYDVVNARKGGYTFEALKLEDLMRRSGEEAKPMTQVERAILSQSMRICFLTLTVMDETALARGDQPPKPNIPGI